MLHRLSLNLALLSVLGFPSHSSASSSLTTESQLPFLSSASPTSKQAVSVNLRIEGSERTIFEGVVKTQSHNVTTPTGGNHHCDGTNNHAHPNPVPATFTAALDDSGIPFDSGPYNYDDFYITTIGGEFENIPLAKSWDAYLNFNYNQVGGCQLEVKSGDNLLWAFNSYKKPLLKLEGPITTRVSVPITLTVRDARDNAAVAGAVLNGLETLTTNYNGQVTVTFATSGVFPVKADKSCAIRSNKLDIRVTA